jgi:hypothetical protein
MEKQVWKRSPIKADGQVVKAIIKGTPIIQSTSGGISAPISTSNNTMNNNITNTPSHGKSVATSKPEEHSAGHDQKQAFDNNLKASLGALYDMTSPLKNKKINETTPISSPISSPKESTKSSSKASPASSTASSPKHKAHSPSRTKYNDGTKISPMQQQQHSPSPYSSPINTNFLSSSHVNNIFNISNFPVIHTKIDEFDQVEPEYYYEFLNNVNNQLATLGIDVTKNDEPQVLSVEEGDLLLESCIKCHQEFVKQGMFL